jgi:hypothetical protein
MNHAEIRSMKPLPTLWMSVKTTMVGLVRRELIVKRITNTSTLSKPGPLIITIKMWLFLEDRETSLRTPLFKTLAIWTLRIKKTTRMSILYVQLLSSKLTWKSRASPPLKNPLMEHSMAPTLSVVSAPTQPRTPSKISEILLTLKTTNPHPWLISSDKRKFANKSKSSKSSLLVLL